ncbi:5,10-methenyltetrahydrofolate synthetase [Scheffersomyces spartinae]|uniref:5-formyltetrahydrofolate cyclo-ligase n=1 Tax=Scheffersomyces spartinae TaxID=45513 RepID=A0A9P7VBG7_9ASCO|nr:5,10-methenyltetrahydrofolate synthetase [Scheffersomyces spartinae]KAG7194812.1 5,10-methenyltetrahydrofolate synthetase [Scheffersomyces spartinae]
MSKPALRKLIKQQLKSAKEGNVQLTLASLESIPSFANASKVGLFISMPQGEVQTMPIIKYCFDQGKQVYLPRCHSTPHNWMQLLRVNSYKEVQSLTPQGKYQLLEPLVGEDILDTGRLDVLIMPGVAFSPTLQRIGHGAGFYDRWIASYHQKYGITPQLIGIGLKEQLVENIPIENHDWPLDAVVIEDKIYKK